MAKKKQEIKTVIPKRYPLVFATIVAFLTVCTAGVSTFAWFQAQAAVNIETASDDATITVAAPEGAKFYYFTGNGVPGGDYTGYSRGDSSIGMAPRNITHDGSTNPSNVAFESGDGIDYYFQEITGSGSYTESNCFDLSKIRPGCYYSFAVSYVGSELGLKLNFRWDSTNGITGDNQTPKRRFHNGSAITDNPLNLLMSLNGWASTQYPASLASQYIKEAFNKGASAGGSGDKISYATNHTASGQDYSFGSGITTTAVNKYIFFTVYMGYDDRSDALLFNSKAGTGASEILYYNTNQTSGDYSALEGLKVTLSKVELTLS